MVFCGKRKRGNSAEWNSEYNQPEKIVWCVPYVPFCACIRAFNAYFSLIRWVQENSSFCLLISFICLYDVTWASVCASGCLTFHTQNNAFSLSLFFFAFLSVSYVSFGYSVTITFDISWWYCSSLNDRSLFRIIFLTLDPVHSLWFYCYLKC